MRLPVHLLQHLPLRLLRWAAGLLLCLQALAAGAASYGFASDSFAWEAAATPVAWAGSCTSQPGDNDQATLSFSDGFTFSFAGTAYSAVRVHANGALQFGADTGFHRSSTPTTLPAAAAAAGGGGCAATATARVLLPHWADLHPAAAGSGQVSWEQKGSAPLRHVVVSWNGVYRRGTTTPVSFQVILYENGEFKYQYGNDNATGSAATIGVQVSPTDHTLYGFNRAYAANGAAIRWRPNAGASAPLADYRMDEPAWPGTPGEVIDSAGNGHHGSRIGGAQSVAAGKLCRGLALPANTGAAPITAVDTTLAVGSLLATQGSVSFWFYSTLTWTSSTPAMLLDAGLDAARPFYLMRNAGGSLRLALTDAAGSVHSATSNALAIAANTWVHVAASWHLAAGSNQSVLRLHVNGVQVGVGLATSSGTLDAGLGTLYAGDNRGSATPAGGTVNSAHGRIDELRVYASEIGSAELDQDRGATRACAVLLDHLEIRHAGGSGVTCTPSTFTLVACRDASCATPYTGGVTGTLAASGTGMAVNWPDGSSFSIPAGSASTTLRMHLTTAGSVTVASSGVAPTAIAAPSCNFGSPRCRFTAADSGLLFNVPHHVAETAQTVSVSAVRKSNNSLACVPAFASVSKTVKFSCGYTNPTTGSLPVRVGGQALNAAGNSAAACDAGGRDLVLAFNASGVASTSVHYADAGQVLLSARHTGSGAEAGLVMTGADSFVAAPAAFAFSAITPGNIRAGMPFAATVTAVNAAVPPVATPNFGREVSRARVSLSFTRRQPTGPGASNGSFAGALGLFSQGRASATNLAWTEVGRGDLGAALVGGNYLASGLNVSGSTGTGGAVGRFVPYRFEVQVSPACNNSFSYAGQPFAVRLLARNRSNLTTVNYDGSAATTPAYAQALSLSDAPALGVGGFGGTGSVAASQFTAGVANLTPAYSYSSKTTGPKTLIVRAIDADGVSSAGFTEGRTVLRSGRLRLANAFGSEKSSLQLPVLAEYWSGNAWVLNSADVCTSVPATAVALSNVRNHQGGTGSWSSTPSAITLSGGNGLLVLSAPVPTATGTVDIALNLGSAAADQSCLPEHPPRPGAGLPWLRSRFGSCAPTWDRDPSARAAFGIYSPESRKLVHAREVF